MWEKQTWRNVLLGNLGGLSRGCSKKDSIRNSGASHGFRVASQSNTFATSVDPRLASMMGEAVELLPVFLITRKPQLMAARSDPKATRSKKQLSVDIFVMFTVAIACLVSKAKLRPRV